MMISENSSAGLSGHERENRKDGENEKKKIPSMTFSPYISHFYEGRKKIIIACVIFERRSV